jgi:hypothetical protein
MSDEPLPQQYLLNQGCEAKKAAARQCAGCGFHTHWQRSNYLACRMEPSPRMMAVLPSYRAE